MDETTVKALSQGGFHHLRGPVVEGGKKSTRDFLLTLLSVLIIVRRMGPRLTEQRLAAE